MSHTPGPWQRCCQNKPRTCGYIFSADGQAYLAKVLELGDGVDPVCNDQDREANARLIAAAPDLLEALKRIERMIGWCGHINDDAKLSDPPLRCEYCHGQAIIDENEVEHVEGCPVLAVFAAIAKAEGR